MLHDMTEKKRALQVPAVAPYKSLGKFPKALYGTTGGTCNARFFRSVMHYRIQNRVSLKANLHVEVYLDVTIRIPFSSLLVNIMGDKLLLNFGAKFQR